MSAYQTVVVGTDGSATSFKAVERAGAIAADANAKLVIVCAYAAENTDLGAVDDVLKGEAFQVHGANPTNEILRSAKEVAVSAGAQDIQELPVSGAPVEVLLQATKDAKADLLVVGSRGLSTLSGRLLGSVPSDVSRKSGVDVLIVHTS